MKITAIKRPSGSSDRIDVHFGEIMMTLPLEVALAAGLSVGDDLDERRIALLRNAEEAWRCKEGALRLIAHRERTRRELRGRLQQRGFGREVIDRCVEELAGAGLLDDEAFARTFVGERLRNRPVGRYRMVAELRSKGVDGETAERVVGEAYREVDSTEEELAARAAGKFRRRTGEDEMRARRRLFGLLSRKGFGQEVIERVTKDLLEGSEES